MNFIMMRTNVENWLIVTTGIRGIGIVGTIGAIGVVRIIGSVRDVGLRTVRNVGGIIRSADSVILRGNDGASVRVAIKAGVVVCTGILVVRVRWRRRRRVRERRGGSLPCHG